MNNFKDYKFRCHYLYELCSDGKGMLTEKQAEEIKALEAKEKLTEKQAEKLSFLRQKRDNPELPEMLKTRVETEAKRLLGIPLPSVGNKYTQKGLEAEDEAIELLSDKFGELLLKNEKRIDNEYITGIPDVLEPLVDNKASWDGRTFPLFEKNLDKRYWWQMQGYLFLTGKKQGFVCYTLINTPHSLIEYHARNKCKENGEEYSDEIFNKYKKEMSFDHLPSSLRIKTFVVDRDENAINKIKERVKMAREYGNKLI